MQPNKLIYEKSPYLLQHAHNPVDWYPWGEEAFEKAARENKPVFLSIGYSTCHWCHVMEKESFEDEDVAQLMNDTFVSIKVDREERPDIDSIYMTVCQMLTGSGGWPLTIIMTPDKKPFFAGTYFSKFSRFGRPGLMELVPQIKEIWENKKNDILNAANEISSALVQSADQAAQDEPDAAIADMAFNDFLKKFDDEYGGFNRAPKFPTPHNFYFLLRYWKNTGNNDALQMTEKTLTQMRLGGIYDHIGFGFHRYSTDREWLVPHFEKMLYDQALLSTAYTETFLATGNTFYRDTAIEILDYVLRDMTSPEGGFYSAEDADSEGQEGKFYLWTFDEITNILKEDAALFIKVFNISQQGNWIDPLHGAKDGTNILHLTKSLADTALDLKMEPEILQKKINDCRKILFEHREKRIHPYKDDKILTDWNSLMISALAKAAQAFGIKKYADAAEKAVSFILDKLLTEDIKLLHRFRDGEAGLPAHLDDYSFFVAALLDLYEATFNSQLLIKAIKINEYMINHFLDKRNGAFFLTADDSERLLARQKELYDGAIPSGNSIAALNLLRLSAITGDTSYEEKASGIFRFFGKQLNSSPGSFSQGLCAFIFAQKSSYEIIIAGKKDASSSKDLMNFLNSKFIPNKVMLFIDKGNREAINQAAPFTKQYSNPSADIVVYVCRNFMCNLPVHTIPELEKLFS